MLDVMLEEDDRHRAIEWNVRNGKHEVRHAQIHLAAGEDSPDLRSECRDTAFPEIDRM